MPTFAPTPVAPQAAPQSAAPLGVQSAPANMPQLTPPSPPVANGLNTGVGGLAAPAQTPPAAAPGASETPTGPQASSPLFQDSFAQMSQLQQLDQQFQTNQKQNAAQAPQRGWLQDLLGPELTGLASGARSIEATPDVAEAVGDAIIGNKEGEQAHLQKANATMKAPIGNVKPLASLNNEEALGEAAQTVGQAATALGAPALGVGLQSGGNAMSDDKGPVQVITDGLLGAAAGKVGEAVAPVAGKVLGAGYDAVVPQAAQDAISGVGNTISSGLKSAANTLNPVIQKLIPDSATSGVLTPLLDKYAPAVSKLFVSSAGAQADDALSTYLSGLGKTVNLRNTLGDEMSDLSDELTKQFPDATISLNASQVQAIQNAAQKAAISLPKFMDAASTATIAGEDISAELGAKIPSVNLTISQAQDLGTSLNQAYEKGYVSSVYDDLRQTVRTSLNSAAPGLGTVYDQMYQTASQGYTALDTLDDIFNSKNRAPNSSDLNNAIAKIQSLSSNPQGKQILSTILDNFKVTTGVDLSSETEAVSAAGKIKDPLAKRAAQTAIKVIRHGGGWAGTALAIHDFLK